MCIQVELHILLLLKMVVPPGRPGQEFHKALHALHKVYLKWEWRRRNIYVFKAFFVFEWQLSEPSLKRKKKTNDFFFKLIKLLSMGGTSSKL